MPAKKRKQNKEGLVRISPPQLWAFEFVREDVDNIPEQWVNLPFAFRLGLARPEAKRLDIELLTEIKETPGLRVSVTYRATFEIDASDTGPEALERELRIIAANIAPSALFPFIRETIATASIKAGLPPLLPPIINFQNLFDPDTVELPSLQQDD